MAVWGGKVVRSVNQLIRRVRQIDPAYAAGRVPMSDQQLRELVTRVGGHIEVFDFCSSTPAMALPRAGLRYPILINQRCDANERSFALRHELAHVLSGDVDGTIHFTETGYMSFPERLADLFALADLLPGQRLADLESSGVTRHELAEEVRTIVTAYAANRTDDWIADRIRLRISFHLATHS